MHNTQETELLSRLTNVHRNCQNSTCVIHAPTQHHMRSWRLHWRDDRGIFERICPHGIGHPDPDQFEFWKTTDRMSEAIHGCCGDCHQSQSDLVSPLDDA